MSAFLILLFVCLCGYGAYRAIRGGFRRSQSERLNGYGIFALALLLLLIASWIEGLF